MSSRGERRAMLVLADAKGNSGPALARHVTRSSEQVTILVPKRFSAGKRGSAGTFFSKGQNGQYRAIGSVQSTINSVHEEHGAGKV